jgi:hypothetical protein
MYEPPLAPSITQDFIDVLRARRDLSKEQMEQQENVPTSHLPYGNITMASLLNAPIAAINSERQALWLHYGTIPQANGSSIAFYDGSGAYDASIGFAARFGSVLCY